MVVCVIGRCGGSGLFEMVRGFFWLTTTPRGVEANGVVVTIKQVRLTDDPVVQEVRGKPLLGDRN